MKKIYLTFFIANFCVSLFAQDYMPIGEKKQMEVRTGIGIQKSFFAELGISYHVCKYSDVGFGSTNFYTSVEYVPIGDVFAIKAGFEINVILLALSLETKYQTDFRNNDFVLTPKVGIGLFGDLIVYYGYNFSTNQRPFENIGKHQVSLVFNIGHRFLGYR